MLDRGVLDSIAAVVGASALTSLVHDYLDQALSCQQAILRAAAAGNLDAMAMAAHDLKATSGTFGATGLFALSEAIERACREGRGDAAVGLAGDLEARRRQAEARLRQLYPVGTMAAPAAE